MGSHFSEQIRRLLASEADKLVYCGIDLALKMGDNIRSMRGMFIGGLFQIQIEFI